MQVSTKVVCAIGLAGFVVVGAGAFRSGDGQARRSAGIASESSTELRPLIHSVEGPELFRAYCATCHGTNGKGNGPAAAALRDKPSDLTALARTHRGLFPAAMVRDTIGGEKAITSHGSREMPIWGPIFHQVEADVDRGHVRMENLVKYLESIQAVDANEKSRMKPISQTVTQPVKTSGAQLFRQNCAVCHVPGVNAPEVPSPFRTPPDLTTLAQRHGGKFPEGYVSAVLRQGVELPAHGPSEMPIWGADFVAKDKLNEKQVSFRVSELTDYLKSIQNK